MKVSTGTAPEKKFSTDASGKIRVVINRKSSVKVPKAVYETKTVVVRESKHAFRRDRRSDEERRPSQNRFSSSDFGGGTMADFFRISQERNKERSSKRK